MRNCGGHRNRAKGRDRDRFKVTERDREGN